YAEAVRAGNRRRVVLAPLDQCVFDARAVRGDGTRGGSFGGVAFGVVDVLLMIPLTFPDRKTAMLGAFLSRFAIGFLIPLIRLPLAPGSRGDWSGYSSV